jgi:hypothetical protein
VVIAAHRPTRKRTGRRRARPKFRNGLALARRVKDAFLRADRTVALKQQIQVDPRPEAHSAAMTAAFMLFKHYPYPAAEAYK